MTSSSNNNKNNNGNNHLVFLGDIFCLEPFMEHKNYDPKTTTSTTSTRNKNEEKFNDDEPVMTDFCSTDALPNVGCEDTAREMLQERAHLAWKLNQSNIDKSKNQA